MDTKTEINLPYNLRNVPMHVFRSEGSTLVDIKISEGCKPGDSYIGEIKRVIATARKGNQVSSQSFILKMQPADKACRERYGCFKSAKNEMTFYSKVLPELNEFLQKATKNDSSGLPMAKFLYGRVENESEDLLVFEDLCVQGFRMTDKLKGLDFDHCILVMKAYAQFHAVSLAMQKQAPEKLSSIKNCLRENLYVEKYRNLFKTIPVVCNTTHQMMESRYPEKVDSLEKLKNLTTNFFDNMVNIVEASSSLKVICHGDCWVNNILFKYDESGTPENLRLIDFQLSRFGSVALDLSYMLFTSCQKYVLDKNWDTFLDTYVTEVNRSLTAMGVEISHITRSKIDDEMRKFGRFGIASAMMIIPFMMTPSEETPNWDKGEENMLNVHRNANARLNARDRLTDVIEFAIGRNIL